MEEFRSYLPDAVILANLTETARRMIMISEQEHAHIAELATEMLAEGRQLSDLLASLPDRRFPEVDLGDETLAENRATVQQMQRLHAYWKKLLLCSELRRGLGLTEHDVPEAFFSDIEEIGDSAKGRVIYQRSNYADAAFRKFSKVIDTAHALYTHSFSVMCEEVMRGNCEYCILPLENSSEGTLHSFSRLIDRYALKIVASCDIPTEDGKRTTRFALLRRTLLPLFSPVDESTLFEYIVPVSDTPSASELLLAAECCGLKPTRIDSGLHTIDGSSVYAMHFVFSVGFGDLSSYLLYLAMQASSFEIIGLYRQESL